jgi:uncharacterized circularly permuted ATP-grasp superfamily protein
MEDDDGPSRPGERVVALRRSGAFPPPRTAFDEMDGATGPGPQQVYAEIKQWLGATSPESLDARSRQAEQMFRRTGITFNVGDADGTERLIPFDLIPRIIGGEEWAIVERGLIQRVEALSAFLADVYGRCEIIRAGVVPRELVLSSPQYRAAMAGRVPPKGVYIHVAGIDLVRTGPDEFLVLEDNTRTPSGVSYMLQNREMTLRLFPELLARARVAAVELYPELLLQTLRSVAPDGREQDPCIVVLTPGRWNSAYFEHGFLADQMGVELVEGSDLIVRDDIVYMRTTEAPRRVDVIYRRIDDAFLDPLAFRSDSMLGVPGLMRAYLAGGVTLVNAPGVGVSDNKDVYSYVPEIIRFYSGQEPVLRNVPTWRCRVPNELAYVLDHLEELVVKEVDNSGGYGMLVGPHAARADVEAMRDKLRARPERFVAQPTLALSTCPVFQNGRLERRHVDLRPFVLTRPGAVAVVPGGLTRVAMASGSLVVNSSQGGGAKDTWVIGC